MMLKFLSDNWIVLAGLATGIAFLFERTFNVIADRRRKKQVYNRCLLELLKLHIAFLKQKELLFNPVLKQTSPQDLHKLMSKGNNLAEQLASFNAFVSKEVELVPELILQSYYVTNILDRLFILIRTYKSSELTDEIINNIYNQQRALIKGKLGQPITAVLYDMALKVSKKGSLPKSRQQPIVDILNPEKQAQLEAADNDVLIEHYAELHRQGQFTDEQFEMIKQVMMQK